jgi:dynein heavy chain
LSREQLSKQHHYDFGLRAIKSVLLKAGGMKRQLSDISGELVLLQILIDANMPKLVFQDVPLFLGLINDIFPGGVCPKSGQDNFRELHGNRFRKE